MSVRELSNGTLEYRQRCPSDHIRTVGEFLRQERALGNRRFVDVRILTDGSAEFVHSAVAFAHSSYIRQLSHHFIGVDSSFALQMLSSQRPPLTLDLSSCQQTSVSKVVDWMYNGQVETQRTTIRHDLEAAASLGVDSLHYLLEGTFFKMIERSENRMQCLNIALDDRCKISPSIRRRLLSEVARTYDSFSTAEIRTLTASTIMSLTANQEVKLEEKIGLLQLAFKWYSLDQNMRDMADCVLSVLNSLIGSQNQTSSSSRPSRTTSQHLVNARNFSADEVEEFGRLPSTRELFPTCATFRPAAQTGQRVLPSYAPDSTNCVTPSSSVYASSLTSGAQARLPPSPIRAPRFQQSFYAYERH